MVERSKFPGSVPFPGMDPLPQPSTPDDPDAKEMLVAHRIDDTVRAVGHAEERLSAALKAPTSALREYHSRHIYNHLAVALSNMHYLLDDFHHHYPAEWEELQAVKACVGLTKSLNKRLRIATTAHLTETVLHELTHAKRHADEMFRQVDPKAVWSFNADHVRKHLKGAQEHIDKLSEHVVDNYPPEGRWLKILKQLQDGHLATDKPAWQALKLHSPPGDFVYTTQVQLLADRLGLPFDQVEHEMIFTRLARGWGSTAEENYRLLAIVEDKLRPGPSRLYMSSVFAEPSTKKDQFGLMQKPSQAVSPSPPLPKKTPLPSGKECLAVVKDVPDGIDVTLSNTVRNALRQAAHKFDVNDVIEALACLRQAQAALYSASRKDAGAGRPAVYGAAAVPPYEQASALAQMFKSYQEQALAWRKVGMAVASLIERTRRNWFGGRINGYLPNDRLGR